MSQNQIIAVVAALVIIVAIIGWAVTRRVRKRLHNRHSRHLRSSRRLHSRSVPPISVAAADVDFGVECRATKSSSSTASGGMA